MRLYDCEQKEQKDLVDSGQDEVVFDKTDFGSKSKDTNYEDFKVWVL